MNEVQFNLRMSRELKARLERESRKKRRSLNNLINLILEDYLDREYPFIPVEGGGMISPMIEKPYGEGEK